MAIILEKQVLFMSQGVEQTEGFFHVSIKVLSYPMSSAQTFKIQQVWQLLETGWKNNIFLRLYFLLIAFIISFVLFLCGT